ncbi:MAG: tRNA lysidine(34) synthetase TilS [Rhizobiales bacterium]|nr:tRNA lysidine(34) synthetase TilS [Hyphomicrobiales bacterium]
MPAAELNSAPIGADEAGALFGWIADRPALAVAVSGGRDSMTLLRLMERWAGGREKPARIIALTVDHGLRTGSLDDARQVSEWCAAIGVEHHCLSWTGIKPRTRIQERAREARYRLMTDWCSVHGIGALALAHHQDDQAETFLMRLARSSGVDGLAAMEHASLRDGIEILRPLIDIPRTRIEATLADFDQTWIDDPSNENSAFERVRIRKNMGALAGLDIAAPAIAASAAKLARAADALSHITDARFSALANVDAAGFATLDGEALAREPQEIALRVMARVIRLVGGRERLSDGALARTTASMTDGNATSLTMGGCCISRTSGKILVVRESRSLPRRSISPGVTTIWDDRFTVSLGVRETDVELAALGKRGFAAARRLNPLLQPIPPRAGWVLPGGFRAGGLALAPNLDIDGAESSLSVRFLRADTMFKHD